MRTAIAAHPGALVTLTHPAYTPPAPSDVVDAIAARRSPHLYAARHTPAGHDAWTSWRLEVAGILREAAAASPAVEASDQEPHTITVAEATVRSRTLAEAAAELAHLGLLDAADVLVELEATPVKMMPRQDDPTGPMATVHEIDDARRRAGRAGRP